MVKTETILFLVLLLLQAVAQAQTMFLLAGSREATAVLAEALAVQHTAPLD
jgi:hypothetical protein